MDSDWRQILWCSFFLTLIGASPLLILWAMRAIGL